MGDIDEACREVVSSVDGAIACAVVDLDSGALLGAAISGAYPSGLDEAVARAAMDLFRRPSATRIEQMIQSGRAAGHDPREEVQISSQHAFHFAKAIKNGKAAMILVTKKTANQGMSWAEMKSAIPRVERHVP